MAPRPGAAASGDRPQQSEVAELRREIEQIKRQIAAMQQSWERLRQSLRGEVRINVKPYLSGGRTNGSQ